MLTIHDSDQREESENHLIGADRKRGDLLDVDREREKARGIIYIRTLNPSPRVLQRASVSVEIN